MERSNLPTSILQSFHSLSLSATTIDFGQDFASNKTPEEIVAAVNHFLQHHTSNKVDKFHLYFCPSEKFLPDIENWLAYVIEKRVHDVSLDFSMKFDNQKEEYHLSLPTSLFECKTLTNLKSLSLSYVNVSGDKLQQLITNCPLLDRLSIINCLSDDPIVVLSSQRLQKLTVVNTNVDIYQIQISAPNLESFVYYGVHIFGDSYFNPTDSFTDTFTDISSLSDAFVCAVESSEPEHDFIKVVHDLRHVKILTVCSYTLWRVTYSSDDEKLPILLQNLRELQLVMDTMSSEALASIYAFFRHCPSPFIEKLFIKLPYYPGDMNEARYDNEEVEEPSDVSFNNLKVIKMSNFKGRKAEMRLVGFLLQKAVSLESLILVWPPKSAEQSMDIEEPSNSVPETAATRINDLVNLNVQLSLLPKAASQARIVLCKRSEEDVSLTPTHTEYFEEY